MIQKQNNDRKCGCLPDISRNRILSFKHKYIDQNYRLSHLNAVSRLKTTVNRTYKWQKTAIRSIEQSNK